MDAHVTVYSVHSWEERESGTPAIFLMSFLTYPFKRVWEKKKHISSLKALMKVLLDKGD